MASDKTQQGPRKEPLERLGVPKATLEVLSRRDKDDPESNFVKTAPQQAWDGDAFKDIIHDSFIGKHTDWHKAKSCDAILVGKNRVVVMEFKDDRIGSFEDGTWKFDRGIPRDNGSKVNMEKALYEKMISTFVSLIATGVIDAEASKQKLYGLIVVPPGKTGFPPRSGPKGSASRGKARGFETSLEPYPQTLDGLRGKLAKDIRVVTSDMVGELAQKC